jgi:hypothetical protein
MLSKAQKLEAMRLTPGMWSLLHQAETSRNEIDGTTMVRVAYRLQRRGFININCTPGDGDWWRITLTEAGKSVLKTGNGPNFLAPT